MNIQTLAEPTLPDMLCFYANALMFMLMVMVWYRYSDLESAVQIPMLDDHHTENQ
jgi:hypothetical protein